MITKQSKAKQSKAEICQHMLALEECTATLHRPACLGLNRWPASIVSRLTLPKLQFSHIIGSYFLKKKITFKLREGTYTEVLFSVMSLKKSSAYMYQVSIFVYNDYEILIEALITRILNKSSFKEHYFI